MVYLSKKKKSVLISAAAAAAVVIKRDEFELIHKIKQVSTISN